MKKLHLLICATAIVYCISGVPVISAVSQERESTLQDISQFSIMNENLVYLGANYVITGICFLDANGTQDLKVEYGEVLYHYRAILHVICVLPLLVEITE